MSFWLSLILAGIGTGCIYSLAGMGIVLTYKATGIFNFAHGAIAMVVAYILWQLNSQWHLGLAIAAPLTVLIAGPGIGLLLERLVFRPLQKRGAGTSEKLVATLGVFLLFVGAAQKIWTGTERHGPQLVSNKPLHLTSKLLIGQDRLAVVLMVAVISVLLYLLFRYTHLGTEIRAVVDRRELSELAAINANRVAALSWAMGAGLAGLTGVLLAPDGLDPVRLTLLVIETFSIAVVARLVSITIAYGQQMLALIVIFVSIVVVTGFSGHITLGQAAFAGMGSFVSVRVSNELGLPVIPSMLIGAVVAVFVGLIAGYPALKRRGLFLGLTTLTIGVLAYSLVFTSSIFAKGSAGLTVHRPSIFGLSLNGDKAFYWFELVWVLLAMVLARNLRSGRLGRILAAMRDSETAARSVGIDLRAYKLFVFGASAFIAGIGGALLSQQARAFSPTTQFGPISSSLLWFIAVIVAGVGSLGGAVIGAAILVLLGPVFGLGDVAPAIIALGALFIGSLPGGSLMGMLQRLVDWGRTPKALLERFALAQQEVAVAGNGRGAAASSGDGLAPSDFAHRVIDDARLERAGS